MSESVEEATLVDFRQGASEVFKRGIANVIGGTGAAFATSLTAQFISLHSADPGISGINEIATTTVYKRAAVTWAAATSGSASGTAAEITSTADLVFNIAANTTVSFYGVWAGGTATGGGTFLYAKELGTPFTMSNVAGKVTIKPTHTFELM